MIDELPRGIKKIRFSHTLDDPGGEISLSLIGSTYPDGQNFHVGLEAGSKYVPGKRKDPATVFILEGEGFFHMGGIDFPYRPGNTFEVPADTAHAFVLVRTDTVFIKQVRFGEENMKSLKRIAQAVGARLQSQLH